MDVSISFWSHQSSDFYFEIIKWKRELVSSPYTYTHHSVTTHILITPSLHIYSSLRHYTYTHHFVTTTTLELSLYPSRCYIAQLNQFFYSLFSIFPMVKRDISRRRQNKVVGAQQIEIELLLTRWWWWWWWWWRLFFWVETMRMKF